ncbi:MAG: amidophosphoribosyltransferase [Verrucomicrobia bacterium]|nr:amidophosphoribosyltransferase [Verrucomicrobiota bacterium]
MCGIAGILFKDTARRPFDLTTGGALVEMLDTLLHRGPDSAGFALYREPLNETLRLRFFIREGAEAAGDVGRIKQALVAQGAEIIEDETVGCTYGAVVRYRGDIQKFSFAMEHAARMVSLGVSLDIIKDLGHPRELAKRYEIARFNGTHAIGHTRLATESGVHPETSHPFWATGFADVSVVHNGQLTNYWIMRRRLERRGMEFHTENDTELIAVYLAWQLSQGHSLEEALRASLDDLDGTFSCIVATRDAIGYAKDKLAAKPMVKYEDDHLVAIASEEVALNRLFPGQVLKTTEPPPLTCGLWSRQ